MGSENCARFPQRQAIFKFLPPSYPCCNNGDNYFRSSEISITAGEPRADYPGIYHKPKINRAAIDCPGAAARGWQSGVPFKMSSMLSRLSGSDEVSAANRRRFSRAPVDIEARVASAHGQSGSMGIRDVSTHGCCLDAGADWLRVGSFLSVGLEDGPPLEGVVRWLRDGRAGVEFLRPVPASHCEWHELINSFGSF